MCSVALAVSELQHFFTQKEADTIRDISVG